MSAAVAISLLALALASIVNTPMIGRIQKRMKAMEWDRDASAARKSGQGFHETTSDAAEA